MPIPADAPILTSAAMRAAEAAAGTSLSDLMERAGAAVADCAWRMAAGAPILMGSVAMLFFAREGASALYLTAWLVVMYLGYSISLLSQMSWASVLSPDYDQRSRIYGWWQVANIIGVLAVLAIPAVVQGVMGGTS